MTKPHLRVSEKKSKNIMRIEEISSASQLAEILEDKKRQEILRQQNRKNELKQSAKETAETMSIVLNELSLKIQKDNQLQLERTYRKNRNWQIFICALSLLGSLLIALFI